MSIDPIWGKNFNRDLVRTEFHFISDKNEGEPRSFDFVLTTLTDERFEVRIRSVRISPHETKERFYAESVDGNPFHLNGNLICAGYLFDRDQITLAGNRITFFQRREQPANEDMIASEFYETDLPVLLEGETGTGKSYLAKKIHERSGRMGRFVHLNLSAFTPTLLESEIFGHAKGSFTGAINDKKGAIEEAHGGTLFLDEIDSLSLEIQTKLLLFFDEQKFRAVGELRERKVKVKIIVASGSDLKARVLDGSFRKDLYYRISSSLKLYLKPLREDKPKIERFCQHFSDLHQLIIAPHLLDFYLNFPWPGNLRQLNGHLLKKKHISKSKKIEFDRCDESLLDQDNQLSLVFVDEKKLPDFREVRKMIVQKTFYRLQGNTMMTASCLKISPTTVKNLVFLS
jgi:transcriptional regulator with PAS, ATPase and Fis domain